MFRYPPFALLTVVPLAMMGAGAAELSFNRDIRPILSDYCYACHGFDKNTREADLRLDTREGALADNSGTRAIVPGHPELSEAIQRMVSDDPDEIMPPPKAKKPMKPEHIALLKEWVKQGAKYEGHWAFSPPVRPTVPATGSAGKNPVDAFIRARLAKDGLRLSPEADRATLLRRVTYDLTGLPPSPAELDAFLADRSPDAYEKVVDRLLASPRYGEKMAVHWLDLSRYADTHGYHLDSGRDMWPWRDWVIESFNRNQRFDEFVRWQLAGDLLPEGRPEQRLATGFVRNNMINFEGGAIAAEYLNAYVVDRVNTVGTVFLGLSVNCAQCHDHKYDPLTAKEYYQLYAYFNAVPENGLDGNKGNAAPVMKMPSPEQRDKIAAQQQVVAGAEAAVAQARAAVLARQAEWEKTVVATPPAEWTVVSLIDPVAKGGGKFTTQPDGSYLITGSNPDADEYTLRVRVTQPVAALRLEALTDDSLAGKGPGRAVNGNFVLSDVRVEPAAGGAARKIIRAVADYEQKGFPAAAMIDANRKSGWAVDGNEKHEARAAWFVLEQPLPVGEWVVKLGFHGGFSGHGIGRVRLATSREAQVGAPIVPPTVAEALLVPAERRNPAQQKAAADFYVKQHAAAWAEPAARLEQAKKELAQLENRVSTVMVMEQMKQPRETHLRVRGDYATLGEVVQPGVPAALGSLPPGAPSDRRSLADWLTDRKNPLLSRVTVNRLWRNVFGTGLVKTVNDFGLQGEWPSHPELLDWLAVEFMDGGWDVKATMRLFVTSDTYRQQANVSRELLTRDPENRLLARGPRYRLSAEEIRDTALVVSGLLNPRIGGASVYPYQPDGIWEELSSRGDSKNWSAQFFEQSHGPDLYRRSMYTFIKRTCPPPQMQTFDAPDREICTAQRERTNTPLQALVTLNDPTYVEASRMLAERVLAHPGDDTAKLRWTFRLATAREPKPQEVTLLMDLLGKQRARFALQPESAAKLLSVGEAQRDTKLLPAELAAWTILASTILNLDETLTRG